MGDIGARECPLCLSAETALLYVQRDHAGGRDFYQCGICDLVFVPDEFHVSPEAQLERYLSHNNDTDDPEYRAFLSRLLDELRPHLIPGAHALDYGAGPGPALAAMMRDEGLRVRTYDPFFQPSRSALEERYSFVTCTETAEHFAKPRRDFDTLDSVLKASSWLGIMTGMLDDWEEFPDWYYHRDPTHVSFYSRKAMSWIGERYSWKALFPRQNVVLFRKSKPTQARYPEYPA